MNVFGRGASVRMNLATGLGPSSGRARSSGANSAFGGASTVTVETLSLYESVLTVAGTITGANALDCASPRCDGYCASDSGGGGTESSPWRCRCASRSSRASGGGLIEFERRAACLVQFDGLAELFSRRHRHAHARVGQNIGFEQLVDVRRVRRLHALGHGHGCLRTRLRRRGLERDLAVFFEVNLLGGTRQSFVHRASDLAARGGRGRLFFAGRRSALFVGVHILEAELVERVGHRG